MMSEIGVTLLHLLMRRSAATMPVAMASCLSKVEEVKQAMIGWAVFAFLMLVACGVNPGRAAHLWGLMPAVALCRGNESVDVMKYAYHRGGGEISMDSCRTQMMGCQFGHRKLVMRMLVGKEFVRVTADCWFIRL